MPNFQSILDAVEAALNVIKTVAETPGVNALPYVSTVASAVTAIQAGIKIGANVAPYVVALADTFSGGKPSQDQLDTLDAKIAELRAKLQAPLPPVEAGEPE